MKRFAALILVLFLFLSASSYAWDCKATHPAINEIAGRLFVVQTQAGCYGDKYRQAPIDFSAEFDGMTYVKSGLFEKLCKLGSLRANLFTWLGRGGHDADMPEFVMGFCHFFDPYYEPRYLTWFRKWLKKPDGGDEEDEQEYLKSLIYRADDWNPNQVLGNRERKLWWQPKVIRPKIDGLNWALNHPDNEYSWENGLRAYKAGMELAQPSESERSKLFGKAFRCLGETMHLMGDMTQPAHVRADSHSIYEPLEKTVDGKMVRSIIGEDWNNPNFKPTPDFILEHGQTPESIMKQTAGFVNNRFFSNDTIFDFQKEVYPRNHKRPYPSPQLSQLKQDKGMYYSFFEGVGWVPLAKETGSLFPIVFRKTPKVGQKHPKCNVVPEMAEHQAKVLIPIAVYGCAEIADRFFPTVELTVKTERGSGSSTIVSGEFIHDVAKDPAWTKLGAIKYTGPGTILVNGKQRLPCQFRQGRLEAKSVQLARNDEVTLMIETGARKIKSLPLKIP